MSCSMALRRSPKPGAFTAATLRPPRSLLTTSVASASPSTSSAMMTQRLAGLHHGLEQRQQLLQARQLLLVDQDVGVVHLDAHLVGVGDEVGRDVAAVELHALDHVELGLERLRLFDRDHALVADLLHRLGEEAADLGVAVGRNGADLGDLVVRGDLLGVGLEVLHDGLDGEVDAALEVHRVHAGGDRLGAFLDDRLGEHGRGRGAVTGEVGGLGGDLAHHLGAHVLELVLELDLLGDGHAVLGDARRAERLVEHDVAALGAERHLHRIGENVDAAQHPVARIDGEFYFFGSHVSLLLKGFRSAAPGESWGTSPRRLVQAVGTGGKGREGVTRPSSWRRSRRARP